jgi:hypothetical protein
MMRLREWLKLTGATCLAMGCSDPPPPPALGGLHMEIKGAANPPAGTSCQTTGATYDFGDPSPTVSNVGFPGQDGEVAEQRISCTVRGDGTFQVAGEIQAVAIKRTDMMPTPIRFTLSNGSVVAGGTGTGFLSIFTTDVLPGLDSDPASPCVIDVSTPPLAVEASRIWATYDCRMQRSPSTYCRVNGVMVFENCLTE